MRATAKEANRVHHASPMNPAVNADPATFCWVSDRTRLRSYLEDRAPRQPAAVSFDQVAAKEKKIILVADDDQDVKDVARDILERNGYAVLTAGSREEALMLCRLRGREVSVALLDVTAPEGDDEALLRMVLEHNPAVKIIITSVYSDAWDPAGTIGRIATGFLKKPYRMAELLRIVETVSKTQ